MSAMPGPQRARILGGRKKPASGWPRPNSSTEGSIMLALSARTQRPSPMAAAGAPSSSYLPFGILFGATQHSRRVRARRSSPPIRRAPLGILRGLAVSLGALLHPCHDVGADRWCSHCRSCPFLLRQIRPRAGAGGCKPRAAWSHRPVDAVPRLTPETAQPQGRRGARRRLQGGAHPLSVDPLRDDLRRFARCAPGPASPSPSS